MTTSNTIIDNESTDKKEYHGIIINLSQKDKSIFKTIEIIGKRKLLLGLLTLHKVKVLPDKIDKVISAFQRNMSDKIILKKQGFYFHFYRDNELIIVFKDKIFKASPDKLTWPDAIAHGRQLKIANSQLDFIPNRFEDEDY
jgi:hypothetical protein